MQPPAPRILLVEDRGDLAAMYKLAFDLEGFETRVANTGGDGLAIAASGWPQLVVLDVQLPDIDGLAVFDAMRRQNVSTPVIFLTIRDDMSTMRQAIDGGAADYLLKPRVKPADIVRRIRHHLADGD
jgi:DNA-binding response OmpR family regulator